MSAEMSHAVDREKEIIALKERNRELLALLSVARTYMNSKGEQSRLDVTNVDAALAKVCI